MKNPYQYVVGMIIWSCFSTMIFGVLIALASMEFTKSYVCIDTIKMILLMLFGNLLLTAVLIKLNN